MQRKLVEDVNDLALRCAGYRASPMEDRGRYHVVVWSCGLTVAFDDVVIEDNGQLFDVDDVV